MRPTEIMEVPIQKTDEISIEKGVGEATINGENIKNEAVYGNGSNKIDIDGGIGKISINFNN